MQNVVDGTTKHPRYNDCLSVVDVSTEYVIVGLKPEKVKDAVTKLDATPFGYEYNPQDVKI